MEEELKDKKVKDQNEECDCENCNCRNHDSNEATEESFDNKLISELEAKNIDLDNKLRRVLADYANLQRDNEKRLEITMNQLKARTAGEIIAVLDDVNFAMQAKEKMQIDEKTDQWINGLVSTLNKLNKSLDVLGVTAMSVMVGDNFDSGKHEALGVVYEGEPETIQTVVQDGYVMASTEIIVRPARVIVSKVNSNS
jgi:molecular chaperone GrpE